MTLYTVRSIIVIFSGRFFDLRLLWWAGEMAHLFVLQRIWVQFWTPPLQLMTVSSGAVCFAGTCIEVEHISSCRLTNIHIYENNIFSKNFAVTVCLWVSVWISELFFVFYEECYYNFDTGFTESVNYIYYYSYFYKTNSTIIKSWKGFTSSVFLNWFFSVSWSFLCRSLSPAWLGLLLGLF